jgi:hypothetical protein
MNKAAYFAPILLFACAACQSHAPEPESAATGLFVSPTLVLTNRHVLQENGCPLIRVTSSDGTLRDADLEFVASPANSEIDLALFRLKKGSYSAAPILLRSFDGSPNSIAEANAMILTYPNWSLLDSELNAAVARVDAVAVLSHRDMAKQVQITIDEDGTITRIPPGTALAPTFQRIVLYSKTAKLIFLYSKALRPGASGSPIVDKMGRLIGVAKGEVNAFIARDFGIAVDSADVASFIKAYGADAKMDDRTDGSGPQPDLSRDVVRLFCFDS